MAFRRQISPDMNLNDVEFGITYQIIQIFDIDRGWEQLASVIGYSTSSMKQFELETRRSDGSPTKKILWDWGTRGGTVRDLYNKLALMNRAQVMRLLEPIMNVEKEKQKVQEKGRRDELEKEKVPDSNDSSMMSSASMSLPSAKVVNMISRPTMDSLSYNPTNLPVPKKTDLKLSSKQDDINLNKLGDTLKSSEEKDLKLQSDILPIKSIKLGGMEHGASSVQVNECHADGPGSRKGNEGAASSVRSFERVKSAIDEYGSQSSNSYMSQLSNEEKEVALALMTTPNYTYKELSQATDGFRVDHKLGQGKFGSVYLGVVKNTKCAIKKLFQKQERNDEDTSSSHLSAELRALSRYRHENIVTLYGYALDGDEVCLIYQFMPNGSLDDCLHQRNGHNVLLDWYQRLNILKNAACGLQFLHSIDKKPVIHGDIKSANILLDRHFDAKIGDLGLAQQATGGTVTGELTHITKKNTNTKDYKNQAYYAPEILRGNGFSVKGDTFAFGVVIFECLTGQEAYDEKREGSTEKNLVDHIESQVDEDPKMSRDVFQDSQVKAPCPQSMFLPLFELAEKCTIQVKKNRPTMVDVFQELERIEKDTSLQEPDLEEKSDGCIATAKALKREISEGYSSYSSTGGYTPGVKVESPAFPPTLSSAPQSKGHVKTVGSPIDCLPQNQPIPEAFKLQYIHDQKKQDDHVYQNVQKLSKISLHDGSVELASDPKKLAKLDREESEESNNNNEGNTEFSKSDPKKVKALEDFDKGVASEHQETESFPPSDPKKLAMIIGQDSLVSGSKSAVEVEYENVPMKPTLSNEEFGYEGDEQDIEGESHDCKVTDENFDETIEYLDCDYDSEMLKQVGVASRSQPIKAGMLGLFDKYQQDKYQQDLDESCDMEEGIDFDLAVEGDYDSESTLTESTCMADFGETETSITEDELFAPEGSHVYENYTPKKEATTTTTETITAHHRRLELYQNMSKAGEQNCEGTEQSDGSQLHTTNEKHTLDFQSPAPKSRAPTEDECYE